jgi:hypothetical protein
MFPKSSKQYKALARLNTPQKIQSFLDSIPFNDEENGETCMSAHRVLKEKKAHCLEGAFLACACLMVAGRKPIIVSLKAKKPDYDHIIILFKENGFFGALSKTGHPVLSYRDPVYKSVRELVMSYFHEYFLFKKGTKTLLGYTRPMHMSRFGTKWITAEEDLWDIATKIYYAPITKVVPPKNKRLIRKVPNAERKALDVLK